MANKKNNHVDAEEKIEVALGKTELFLQKHTKQLLTILAILVIIVGGYFAYKYLYTEPQARKAADSMFVAQQLFEAEDFETALNGDGSNAGFIEVVDNFGGTKPGRLAAHYAGICYLQQGDLDNALTYLQKYKPAKGATAEIVNAQNLGLQGDIYVQKADYAQAADLYTQAVDATSNILTTPYFLKKLAEVQVETGDNAAALESYRRIKSDYAGSLEARDIDKYIGALEQL
jgi:predicted negative regulator of RcsB-dependent stress response